MKLFRNRATLARGTLTGQEYYLDGWVTNLEMIDDDILPLWIRVSFVSMMQRFFMSLVSCWVIQIKKIHSSPINIKAVLMSSGKEKLVDFLVLLANESDDIVQRIKLYFGDCREYSVEIRGNTIYTTKQG